MIHCSPQRSSNLHKTLLESFRNTTVGDCHGPSGWALLPNTPSYDLQALLQGMKTGQGTHPSTPARPHTEATSCLINNPP